MRVRIFLILTVAATALLPAAGASAPETPATAGPLAAGSGVGDEVEDDLLQITVDRLHAEAGDFFSPDSRSISVIRLDDRHLASADGDVWHISLSAAKALWVVVAVQTAGADAVQPHAGPVFQNSNNGAASLVISLVGSATSKGVDAINTATWSWGLQNTYLYGWFNASGTDYGYHKSSKPLPGWTGSTQMWWTNNFTSTDDLARFWAMLANGDLLDAADTTRVLRWAALPRSHDGNELIPNRLPAAVAAEVSHKAGWNGGTSTYPKSRRIDGGVVTTPDGVRYAIAVSFRTSIVSQVDGGGAAWARYASCEIYNVIADAAITCTRAGDPSRVVGHTTAPIGSLSSASAERDRLRVSGWALDRDAGAAPVDVRVTVDGRRVGTVTADQLDDAVHRRHGMGNYHGFRAEFAVGLTPGNHQVCATALNDSATGSNSSIGCRAVTVPNDHPPIGGLTEVRVKKGLVVAWGWARDLDTAGPIEVKLTLDGSKLRLLDADRGAGGHGFKARLNWDLPPGEHEICAIAQNYAGGGRNRAIGCRTVAVPGDWPPEGSLAAATVTPDGSQVWVSGRAWDPDAAGAIEVRVVVDGVVAGTLLADLGTSNRRYAGTVPVALLPGDHTVCTLAVDHTGGGPITELGCGTVTVAAA